MSLANSKSKRNKQRSDKMKDNISLTTYEYARQVINKQIETLKEEMNRTEIEWLNLCNLTQQSKSTPEVKLTEPLFKDAAELNAVPLPVKLEGCDDANLTLQLDDVDNESSDDE